MSIFNLGSINADHFYRVPHLPEPGETLAATAHHTGLGGKGANQSVAAARAGSNVVHIGAIGSDGHWARTRLEELGVDISFVNEVGTPTGHAIINVDEAGENAIVIYSGANQKQSLTHAKKAIRTGKTGDILLLQNETNLQVKLAKAAKVQGLYVVYSAAPFASEAVREMLPYTDLLVVNDVEAAQLAAALKLTLAQIPVANVLVTHGAKGSTWHDQKSGENVHMPAFPVTPVDTTGAGDCFIGYTAAGLDQGLSTKDAMRLAAAAAALKVTRQGTADAIPTRTEVDNFLTKRLT